MKSFTLFAVIIFYLSLFSFPAQAGVIELNRENFNRVEKGTWIVKFYAPWCQHCKKLAPVWEEVANHFTKNDIKVKVAKIDCEANSDVCTKEGATGYPTIKYYIDGIQKNYVGGRKKNDVLNFVLKMNKPITIEMKKEKVPNAFKQELPSFILFSENPSPKITEVYTLVAKHVQDVVSPEFYFLKDKSIAQEFVSDLPDPSIVVYKEGDRRVYNGKIDFDELLEFARANQFAYLNKYSESTYNSLIASGRLLVLCVTDTISKEQEKFTEDCKTIGKQRADDKRYLFASLDALQYDRYATSFGAVPDILPTVVVINDNEEIHYIQPEEKYTSPEKINSFLKEIEAGNIKSQTWSYAAYYSKKANKFFTFIGELIWQHIIVVSVSSILLLVLFIVKCCLPENNKQHRVKSE